MTAQSPKMLSATQPSDQERFAAKVEEAKAAVASLKAQFTTLVEDDLAAIEAAYGKAQIKSAGRVELVREIFNVAHNIKGQGSSFGYDLLTEVADLLCRRTRDVSHITEQSLESIGFHVRALRVIVDGKISGRGGDKGVALIAKLQGLPGADLGDMS